MMETPFLRVSRPVSACSRCRAAKIKCDGKLPACSACERANKVSECSSANDQFAKGKERSYVASLESRIEKLEKQVALTKRRKGSAIVLDFSTGVQPPPLVAASSIGKKLQQKEASNVDDLVSDFGYLSLNATSRDYHGFTQQISYARLVLSASSVENMPRLAMTMLPPKDVSTTLVQNCIKETFVLYPVLSDTAAFGSLEAVYQQRGYYCTPHDYWNVRMMLAISLMVRSKFKGDEQYQDAVRHASSALEYAESVIQPGSVNGVQATLLLALYSILDPTHFNCWYIIGVASRIVVDLGLHEDIIDDPRMKSSQVESRRRLFHCVYALDRAISISYIRPFSFSDASVNVEIPAGFISPLALFEASNTPGKQHLLGSMNSALDLLKFRQIQSSWYQVLLLSNRNNVKQPWQTRCHYLNEMQDWYSSLPESTPPVLKLFFRSETLYALILLIWPLGLPTMNCPYGRRLIFDYAFEYAEATRRGCDRFQNVNCFSSNDMPRASFVGQRLLEVVQESPYSILNHVVQPQAPPVPPHITIPQLRAPQSPMLVLNAIKAITIIEQILCILGERFGKVADFEGQSTLHSLYSRHQYQNPVVSSGTGTMTNLNPQTMVKTNTVANQTQELDS